MPDLKPGDAVLYTPHDDHHLDADHLGAPLFAFHAVESAPRGPQYKGHQPGDALRLQEHGTLQRDHTGQLHTGSGHKIRHGRPLYPWKAVVIRVNADGSADLFIMHPCRAYTITLPDREACREEVVSETTNADGTITRVMRKALINQSAPGIKYDPHKAAHTFHLPGE